MSVSPIDFFKLLQKNEITFFSGVPDSLLKEFNNVILKNVSKKNHIVTANEGSAIALATGYHLATQKIPVVYLQNSGLGNTINPLLSLASDDVYSIPILLIIGWRGQPGVKDEPQHISQGKCMINLLKSMNTPFEILPNNMKDASKTISTMVDSLKKIKKPHVLIVEKNTFSKYSNSMNISNQFSIERHNILENLMNIFKKDIILSTTGKSSREILHYFNINKLDKSRLFFNVGAMGHVSMISMGIAMFSNKRIVCIDGDGSIIMHMGNLSSVGTSNLKNYIHICLNNGMHQSVGIQPTNGFNINLKKIAEVCNYTFTKTISNINEFNEVFKNIDDINGPVFIEIRVSNKTHYDYDLPRPNILPIERKNNFIKYLNCDVNSE